MDLPSIELPSTAVDVLDSASSLDTVDASWSVGDQAAFEGAAVEMRLSGELGPTGAIAALAEAVYSADFLEGGTSVSGLDFMSDGNISDIERDSLLTDFLNLSDSMGLAIEPVLRYPGENGMDLLVRPFTFEELNVMLQSELENATDTKLSYATQWATAQSMPSPRATMTALLDEAERLEPAMKVIYEEPSSKGAHITVMPSEKKPIGEITHYKTLDRKDAFIVRYSGFTPGDVVPRLKRTSKMLGHEVDRHELKYAAGEYKEYFARFADEDSDNRQN